ncbi:thioredoxin family protein [Mucilaginibacter gossypii]|uniref:thioredoxin family protein n=1 Tax=Mucilaginibacter gossypii TaxID=551996 RepID=UPI000DCBF70E|nr:MULTISPECIES: thioredoxin family protein [Mucilaginibacter]QTE35828.1 thioredoxin family protein [Mucilaginibacter gossypii]RAV54633.1 glutaredoxin [Mucilaginibacter rubeus]
MKRKIEIFTAGCPVCAPVIEMVKSLTCENCDVQIYNLAEQSDPEAYVDKLKEYKITSLPSVVINGKAIPNSEEGITMEKLVAAGIGQAF